MFENPSICDQFLNYWRNTGNQRLGIMYGRYELHKDIPLAIKAVVAVIYEPPQINSLTHIELLDDPKENHVQKMGKRLGLVPVGWIVTDLVTDDLTKGTVKNFRGDVESYFLSAEECIMAAQFQNKYPNPCKYSKDGYFGSKFVTVIVTGDHNGQINFEGYQVSNVAMALVRDDCLIPTKDAPELGYVKETSNAQYVPDVFYSGKDEYGNQVTHLGRPLPVEYLLVDMAAAFPLEPQFTFRVTKKPFPKENRNATGEVQDFNSLIHYMEQFPPSSFFETVSDFHLLLYLATTDMLPLKEKICSLLEAVRTGNEAAAHGFKNSEEWTIVEEMMAVQGSMYPCSFSGEDLDQSLNDPTSSGQDTYVGPIPSTLPTSSGWDAYVGPIPSTVPPIAAPVSPWTCIHCTFYNKSEKDMCEMCSLPRNL